MSRSLVYGLTLWRPWSDAIAHGPKRVENRTWVPPKHVIGTRIAIHAGKAWDEEAYAFCVRAGYVPPTKQASPQGVVATARIVGCAADNWDGPEPMLVAGTWGSLDLNAERRALVSRWYCGPYGWLLDDVHALREPIPCRGAQGLWLLPPDVVALLAGGE